MKAVYLNEIGKLIDANIIRPFVGAVFRSIKRAKPSREQSVARLSYVFLKHLFAKP